MPARSAQRRSAVARHAALVRWQPDAADEARREVKALRAEDYVRGLLEQPPALTADQLGRIALLLRPDGGASA